jgi:hypothetical protein
MKKKLLSVSLTLPMLIIGVGQSSASIKAINPGNFQLARPPASFSQATLNSQQPPPFLLAARDEDERTKECTYLGICDSGK